MKKATFVIMAFCAGASVMIVELAANRILAPWFGNSLFTWTGLIGVILISMSLGSYLGGKIIDKFPNDNVLKIILLTSGILVVMIPGLQSRISSFYVDADLIWGPVSACLILFSVPGILLGSITPIVIRLVSLISSDQKVGFSAGSISSASTLGSVVGTFATGFILIPNVGIKNIYFTTGVVLICLSLVLIIMNYIENKKIKKKEIIIVTAVILVSLSFSNILFHKEVNPNLVFEKNTFYQQIKVIASKQWSTTDTALFLMLDKETSGAQFIKSSKLPLPYQNYWELVKLFTPKVDNVLFLGGGAYGMPIALANDYKEAVVEVVEIDPGVIEVGKQYFKLNENKRVNPIASDARRFLNLASKKYDLIFGDAYNGVRSIPPHLVTKEFFSLVSNTLTKDGCFIINMIGNVKGDTVFFKSMVKTLNSVFKNTYVFISPSAFGLYGPLNIITVASNSDVDFKKNMLNYASNKRLPGLVATYLDPINYNNSESDKAILFTDDYNPTEYIIASGLLGNYE